MEALLMLGAAFLLFGSSGGSSGGGYSGGARQPAPSGTSPTRPGTNDWGKQLGDLFNGLGGGIGKVVDAAQDSPK